MPAPRELLASWRVLGADEKRPLDRPRGTDVAADAAANVVEPALLDLARQEGIGDRPPGRADDVEVPDANRLGHRARIGEAPDPDNRLGRVRL